MKFTLATVLALGTSVQNSDAFLSPTVKLSRTDYRVDQKNVGPLASSEEDEDIEKAEQSGSRFQEMLNMAKQAQGQDAGIASTGVGGRAVQNPFLKPQQPTNPGELSVEEQARMFREMMAGNQAAAAPVRVPSDPGVGKVGRNPDADKIANTSDLYFAQLKRDSTVRTIGRIQGNEEVSEAVFQDKGIKELDGLLLSNPHLKGRQDEEKKLLDSVPDQFIAPYFRSDEMEEEEKTSAGISYKQKLEERRKKKAGAASAPAPAPAPKEEVAEVTQVVEPPPAPEPEPEPEPVVVEVSTPAPVQPEPEQEVVVPQASTTPPLPTPKEAPAPVVEEPRPVIVTSSDDVRQQNLRTFMGLILKHRGGPGFGKGRLKGPDVDLFEGLVDEVTNMLRDEARNAAPVAETPVSASPAVVEATPVPAPAAVAAPEAPPAASGNAEPANIDSTIACIEGAITMYNNSPPAIRQSVLVTLQAALQAAVDTCNVALAGQPAPPIAAGPDASVEGMVACIEGAVTMYKNSPPALKGSVLVTLRMALMSAVETCNVVLSSGQVAAPPASVAPPPAVQAPPPAQPAAPVAAATIPEPPAPAKPVELDRNSKALEKLYEVVQSASGDGKLGLRSDLTADEASALADELVGMRTILMQELEAGIPEPGEEAPEPAKAPAKKKPVSETSTASKYQQMLEKARAEKANA